MNILYLSSEAVPFAKTGGLGDVSGVLPRAMAAGEKVSLMIPGYLTEKIKKSQAETVDDFSLAIGAASFAVQINKATVSKNFSVYFVANDHFFARDHLYGEGFG